VPFCWEDGRSPHPDTITRRFKRLAASAGLSEIDLHDVRHSCTTAGRNAKIDWKALSKRIGHADVAFTVRQYVSGVVTLAHAEGTIWVAGHTPAGNVIDNLSMLVVLPVASRRWLQSSRLRSRGWSDAGRRSSWR
jgi:hypothetical protein